MTNRINQRLTRTRATINKVVIPAAGQGTRLFPATKEQPKEMLPIFCRLKDNSVAVKPLLQLVYEQLYDVGFREFCFVVGRGKRSIEDHFTPHRECVDSLTKGGKFSQAQDMKSFYERILQSIIVWVNQPEPRGFGDSVSMARAFVQDEGCLVHAGDTYIMADHAEHLKILLDTHERLKADAAFIVHKVQNPQQYGVIDGELIEKDVYRVRRTIEKPQHPHSDLAISAIYCFNPIVFQALEDIMPGKNGEIQLTDAIQRLVDWGLGVYAVKLDKRNLWLDIGNPEAYWSALLTSYYQPSEYPSIDTLKDLPTPILSASD